MDERHPGGEVRFDLLHGKIAAEAVVARRFLARGLLLPHLLQALGGAETAVGVPALEQSRGVLPVELGPLALPVGTERTADVRPLVPLEAEPAQDIDDPLLGSFDVAVAVGVLDAKEEGAVSPLAPRLPVRQQPVEERGAGAADVQQPGRARREADADGRRARIELKWGQSSGENLFARNRLDTRRRVYAAYSRSFEKVTARRTALREAEESDILRGREHPPDVVIVPVGHRHEALDESPIQLCPSDRVIAHPQQGGPKRGFDATERCRAATTG